MVPVRVAKQTPDAAYQGTVHEIAQYDGRPFKEGVYQESSDGDLFAESGGHADAQLQRPGDGERNGQMPQPGIGAYSLAPFPCLQTLDQVEEREEYPEQVEHGDQKEEDGQPG